MKCLLMILALMVSIPFAAEAADEQFLPENSTPDPETVAPAFEPAQPRSFAWGWNFQPTWSAHEPLYRFGYDNVMQHVRDAGGQWIRLDVDMFQSDDGQVYGENYWVVLDSILQAAEEAGLKVCMMLHTNYREWFETATPEEIYGIVRTQTERTVVRLRQRVNVWELENEREDMAMPVVTHGYLPSQYDSPNYPRVREMIRGISDGVAAQDPDGYRIYGVAGWLHYGIFQKLIDDGVQFEGIVYHWYSDMGDLDRVKQAGPVGPDFNVLNKLSQLYHKPIWLTEIGHRAMSDPAQSASAATYLLHQAQVAYHHPNVAGCFFFTLYDLPVGGDSYGFIDVEPGNVAQPLRIVSYHPAYDAVVNWVKGLTATHAAAQAFSLYEQPLTSKSFETERNGFSIQRQLANHRNY